MLVNVVEAKAKFSNLLSLAHMGKDEVVIAKRDKPLAVLVSYDKFMHMKKQLETKINLDTLNNLPSSLDNYVGIVSEEELDYGYKESREAYLKDKYL